MKICQDAKMKLNSNKQNLANELKDNYCLEIIDGLAIEYYYYQTLKPMLRAKKKFEKKNIKVRIL